MAFTLMYGDEFTRIMLGDLMEINRKNGTIRFFRDEGERLLFADLSAKSPKQDDAHLLSAEGIHPKEEEGLVKLLEAALGFEAAIVKASEETRTYRFQRGPATPAIH